MLFSLRIALKSLATHKMRTVLAMLGVFLGAFALTGVLHVTLAMERKAVIETEKLGPNLLMAMTGNIRFRRGDIRPDAGNTNLKLPIFKPTKFEQLNTDPGWLFKPSEKYDKKTVSLRPGIMPLTSVPAR